MASRTKQYDKNRFRKVYPRFRAEPRPGLLVEGDGDVVIETAIVSFDGEDMKTVTLPGPYSSLPSLTVSPFGDSGADVNLYITSAVLQTVPAGANVGAIVTIKSSAAFTGKVHLQAIQA